MKNLTFFACFLASSLILFNCGQQDQKAADNRQAGVEIHAGVDMETAADEQTVSQTAVRFIRAQEAFNLIFQARDKPDEFYANGLSAHIQTYDEFYLELRSFGQETQARIMGAARMENPALFEQSAELSAFIMELAQKNPRFKETYARYTALFN